MPTAEETGFVPEMYLSTYVHKQLSALHHCDTITIDPHKSGFCPYPAGALCYRDKTMNTFLQITTTVVYYHGDMTLGDIGIEGSKPGAAAAGVMLANRVTFFFFLPRVCPRNCQKTLVYSDEFITPFFKFRSKQHCLIHLRKLQFYTKLI